MSRRLLKILVFVIAFMVPVSWYLFLQLFGENKFELEVIRSLDNDCLEGINTVFLLSSSISVEEKNELNRLSRFLDEQQIKLNTDSLCLTDVTTPLALVDRDKQLRGTYGLSILEIDRAIVEIRLLLKLQEDRDER